MAAIRRAAMCASRNIASRTLIIATTAQRIPASQPLSKTAWSRMTSSPIRQYASEASPSAVEPPEFLNERELDIFNKLKEALEPELLEVQDVSGGCGSMYGLDITSKKFKGLPIVKQHRLVSKILEEEIKQWHGVQMKTRAP